MTGYFAGLMCQTRSGRAPSPVSSSVAPEREVTVEVEAPPPALTPWLAAAAPAPAAPPAYAAGELASDAGVLPGLKTPSFVAAQAAAQPAPRSVPAPAGLAVPNPRAAEPLTEPARAAAPPVALLPPAPVSPPPAAAYRPQPAPPIAAPASASTRPAADAVGLVRAGAPEAPSPATPHLHAFPEVLAQARRWVAATPAAGESPPAPAAAPAAAPLLGPEPAPAPPVAFSSAEPRRPRAASAPETSEQVHVSIGAITVTIEDPAPARPAPPVRAPSVGSDARSRLARHYLRAE